MSWRPDDWDKFKPHSSYELGEQTHDSVLGKIAFSEGVEAGADAIVRALREEQGVRITKATSMTTTPIFEKAEGWLVFIPDKEGE